MRIKLPYFIHPRSLARLLLIISLIIGATIFPSSAGAAEMCYVNANASGSNIGTSWTNAYTNLQSALADSCTNIWVAAGTYKPHTSDRSVSFALKNGVSIYGGFSGIETMLNQRNPTTNVTILSGDIGVPGSDDNSYHVLVGNSGINNSAVLDGFTVSGGNANGNYPNNLGGGMYNNQSNPTLANVTFSANTANDGGGMYNAQSSPILNNVTFSGNSAVYNGGGISNSDNSHSTLVNVVFSTNTAGDHGGGINNWRSSPTLTKVTFSENIANSTGGGLANFDNSHSSLLNVIFMGNSSTNYGGGIRTADSNPTLINVTFWNNFSARGGGMSIDGGNPILTNVTFSANSANYGGGIYNGNNYPTLTNVILWGNIAPNGPEIYNNAFISPPIVTYSLVKGGYAGTGNINVDPLFIDAASNDFRLQSNSPAADAGDNDAVPTGVATDLDGKPRFVDNPDIIDSGNGTPPIVDMGAYEVQPAGFFYWIFIPLIQR